MNVSIVTSFAQHFLVGTARKSEPSLVDVRRMEGARVSRQPAQNLIVTGGATLAVNYSI